MRVGIVSDIHGNAASLQHAIDEMSGTVEEILCAGDAFSDHKFSNEVIETLRASEARYILGNHELNMLSPVGVRARERASVRQENVRWVAERETSIRADLGGKRLLMVHGSPWDPFGEYLHPGHAKLDRSDELECDILVMGHTHIPFFRRIGGTLIVNPGSLGRPERPEAPGIASYMVLDTDSDEVELIEFPLPVA